jgi:hypothetical protein
VKKPPIRAYAETEVIAMEIFILGRKILPKEESKTAAKAEQKEGAHRFFRKNAKLPPDVQGKSIAKVRFLNSFSPPAPPGAPPGG